MVFTLTLSDILFPFSLVVLSLSLLKFSASFIRIGSLTKNFPPGPPRKHVVGNALQIPKRQPWLIFTEWGKTYGSVVYLRVFSRSLVVLNTHQAVVDLFEKRSSTYSNRPVRPMATLCGFGKALLFQNYGETVRAARKLMYTELSPRAAQAHQGLQEDEAKVFARRLLSDPNNFAEHLRTSATASLLMITYGYKVKGSDDSLVIIAEDVMRHLTDVVTPNNYLVDALPFLKHFPAWFPGCSFQRTAAQCKALLNKFMDTPFLMVLDQMKAGVAPSSFTSNNLEGRWEGMTEDELELLKWTAGGLYAAGADTTVSVLTSFILSMALNRDAQEKAQTEIDKVIGPGNLPKFADRPRLPYVECVIKEVLRCSPPAPLIGHSSLNDDVYEGYFIPGKSVVMANTWAITHDPEIYSEPDRFNPDRFLSQGAVGDTLPDPRMYVFGFGRRACPGIHLADALIYAIASTILAAFDISIDPDHPPKVEYTTGAVSHPLPFTCNIVPRSAAYASNILIASEI